MKRDVKKKNCFIALSFVLIFSIFLNSTYAISLGQEKQIKTMEQIVSENLVKTQKVVVKDADTEEVKYERNLTPSPKLRTMSAVSEDVTLVSGESATYYDEYNNIQDLKNAIIENYPEKDDEEVAKDILRALDQDEDVINSITTNEIDVILQYNTAMGASIYYMDNEITDENITASPESTPITKTQAERLEANRASYDGDIYGEWVGQVTQSSNALKCYTWAAHYGKHSDYDQEKFVSYATVRWLNDPPDKYNDYIALATNATGLSSVPENPLMSGLCGYIQKEYECTNYKNVPGDESSEYVGVYEGDNTYEHYIRPNGTSYSNSDKVNVRRIDKSGDGIDIIQFTSPFNMPINNDCDFKIPGRFVDHVFVPGDTKYYVSGCQMNNKKTIFKGVYYHICEKWTNYKKVDVNASINTNASDISFNIGANISSTWESSYVENKYLTPIIIAYFNSDGTFKNWQTIIT